MAWDNEDRADSLGFEDKPWAAADVLRNSMDPAEYKHVVLGLIFLEYISDAIEQRPAQLRSEGDPEPLEHRDGCVAENVFGVPQKGGWSTLQRGDTLHRDLRADFVMANPPFNLSSWGGERLAEDVRWTYGAPPAGRAQLRSQRDLPPSTLGA